MSQTFQSLDVRVGSGGGGGGAWGGGVKVSNS